MPSVTISAPYGAGGSRVARQVAERLDAQFIDRAIPVEVARRLAVPLEDALARDETARSRLDLLLAKLAPPPEALYVPERPPIDESDFQRETERVIELAAGAGDVVMLGRAAAMVLGRRPGVLHVRLDGPLDARIAQAARLAGIDEDEARRRQRDNDRAREAYVRHFYRTDPADACHYHLVVDSTAVALATVVELVVTAAEAMVAAPAGLAPPE